MRKKQEADSDLDISRSWRFRSSRMWQCVVGHAVPDA